MKSVDLMTAPLRDLRLLRIAEVARLVGLCESRIRELERAGTFPRRIAIGANSAGFLEGDVRRWLADRAASGKLRPSGAVTDTQKATATRKRAPINKGAAK